MNGKGLTSFIPSCKINPCYGALDETKRLTAKILLDF
jgi:hypothetical protein